jgi:hypothetical protein
MIGRYYFENPRIAAEGDAYRQRVAHPVESGYFLLDYF